MDTKIPYYKTPEGKIKNSAKAKRHYESRKNIVLECVACNSSFNDSSIYKHIKTKKHLSNKSKLVEECNDDEIMIIRRVEKKDNGEIWWHGFEVVNKSIN